MNVVSRLAVGFLVASIIVLSDCGRIEREPPAPITIPIVPIKDEEVPFKGSARFGSQCPYGSYVSPQEVPLELWSCPLGLSEVELAQPLAPLVLQVDCKKRIIDVRGDPRSRQTTTWEVMPDGSFFFAFDAGMGQLKSDGSGNSNCSVPLLANMWGRLDCTDRDRVTINLETVWWLDKVMDTSGPFPGSSPSPGASPSSSPSTSSPWPDPTGPSTSPWPGPTVPTTNPWPSPTGPSTDPWPSPTGPSTDPWPSPTHSSGHPSFPPSNPPTTLPWPSPTTPSAVPWPSSAVAPSGRPTTTRPGCKLPSGCYFHNLTQIKQCS